MITTNNRLGASQQNSLYGSTFNQQQATNSSNNMQPNRQSHMFDLANLQQSVFDSAYDDATSSLVTNQQSLSQNMSDNQAQRQQQQLQQNMATTNRRNNNGDLSLYSPSSSTSLLYHIYDQINPPNEQQSQYNQNQQTNKKNNTTILNPANLFGATNQQQQQAPPTTTIQLHQHQMSQAAEFQKIIQQQQSLYSSGQYHLQQPFNTLHHNSTYLGNQNLDGQMMLDSALRQHHATATMARHNHHHHARPLSSSGASSMSGQSMALTYGRQARAPSSGKGQSNLANVLQSSNTLNHLGIGTGQAGHLTPATCSVGAGPKKLAHFSGANKKWKRAQQRARKLGYEYGTIFKCSILLILLAFSLMSIIKFTLMNQAPNSSASLASHQANIMMTTNGGSSNNPLVYPPFKRKLFIHYLSQLLLLLLLLLLFSSSMLDEQVSSSLPLCDGTTTHPLISGQRQPARVSSLGGHQFPVASMIRAPPTMVWRAIFIWRLASYGRRPVLCNCCWWSLALCAAVKVVLDTVDTQLGVVVEFIVCAELACQLSTGPASMLLTQILTSTLCQLFLACQ